MKRVAAVQSLTTLLYLISRLFTIMTYTTIKPTTKLATLPTSCFNCPKFKDYHDPRGRGWCLLFNQVSFKQHQFTHDCELERVTEEDIIRSLHNEGDKIKVIDSATDHTQWTTCIVVAKKFNPYRYRTVESSLNEVDWYYQLADIESLKVFPQWFAENDICHYKESAGINPEGEF